MGAVGPTGQRCARVGAGACGCCCTVGVWPARQAVRAALWACEGLPVWSCTLCHVASVAPVWGCCMACGGLYGGGLAGQRSRGEGLHGLRGDGWAAGLVLYHTTLGRVLVGLRTDSTRDAY